VAIRPTTCSQVRPFAGNPQDVSGNYLSNPDNRQYYLDLKKTDDFDP